MTLDQQERLSIFKETDYWRDLQQLLMEILNNKAQKVLHAVTEKELIQLKYQYEGAKEVIESLQSLIEPPKGIKKYGKRK